MEEDAAELTRFGARLPDPRQERRFLEGTTPALRLTTLVVCLACAGWNLAVVLVGLGSLDAPGGRGVLLAHAVMALVALGCAPLARLVRDYDSGRLVTVLIATIYTGIVAAQVLLDPQARASVGLLLSFSVFCLYIFAPLPQGVTTALAVGLSVVGTAAYALVASPADLAHTPVWLLAAYLSTAHPVGFIAALRHNRSQRTSFALWERTLDLSRRDDLTRLPNRRAAQSAMARAEQDRTREGTPAAVLLVDVDHFKGVNDALGHEAGDEVLRRVAEVMDSALARSPLGEGALLARYGGEEFVVVATGHAAEAAAELGEVVRRAVHEEAVPRPAGSGAASGRDRVTVSVGVAVAWPKEPVQAATARADAALYEAKQDGRDRVVLAGERRGTGAPPGAGTPEGGQRAPGARPAQGGFAPVQAHE
ncbi:diguanylate cyclase (GGDEF)-like protein [Kineococcus xinjiangensis]|uniref:Diguanylate cyclase (GGDEF)-like protein n=1 Tax=Kineococcus xinjiangensis TaxID=512762 RepID=A0A2S6IPS1_9ACTN|nr:GGDEF domain-containing protein [Kineococcus xinjiangensis]PPK96086.1 diguanylate cyclase (GGDEF)-like protein [Kineococcus xinjiangensis]